MDEFYQPVVLDPDKHDRSQFRCGNPSMDDWLRKYAGQNRRGNTAATWVIADSDWRVACYATLSMTSIDCGDSGPRTLVRGAPKKIPALLVGRLATDVTVAGLGLGTSMVAHIMATAVGLNRTAALRAVVVNALDPDAYKWWQRFGFVPLDANDDANLDLYMLTKDIEATLSQR